jgi:predicted nucleic acid-binding protein
MTLPWIFRDEKSEFADEAWKDLVAEAAIAHVPGLWSMEVVQIALHGPKSIRGQERPKPSKADLELFFAVLRRMPLRCHHQGFEVFLDQAVPLIGKYKKLSSYDAAYVVLARRLNLPLATRDEYMEKVATAEGIEVLV